MIFKNMGTREAMMFKDGKLSLTTTPTGKLSYQCLSQITMILGDIYGNEPTCVYAGIEFYIAVRQMILDIGQAPTIGKHHDHGRVGILVDEAVIIRDLTLPPFSGRFVDEPSGMDVTLNFERKLCSPKPTAKT